MILTLPQPQMPLPCSPGLGRWAWLGIPVSSILCFPHHIPVTHLIDSLTKSLILVMVWEMGGGLASILFLGPSLSWEKRVPLLVCVSCPDPKFFCSVWEEHGGKADFCPHCSYSHCSGLWRCPLPPPTTACVLERRGPPSTKFHPSSLPTLLIYSNLLTSARPV